MRTTKKFDIVLFITSHAAGLAAWLVGTVLYHALEEKMAQSLLIGLEFLLLFVIVSAAVIIVGAVKGTFEDFVLFLDEKWKIFLFLAAGGIAVFGLGVLFQFLYGLNSEKLRRDPPLIFS